MRAGPGLFQRKHRLNKASDYNRIFKTSCRSGDSQFLVLARRNDRPYPRLGLAISKRALKTAVSRNKVKRTIRESFRQHADSLSGLDVVVLARNSTDPAQGERMRRSLAKHWQRILQCAA